MMTSLADLPGICEKLPGAVVSEDKLGAGVPNGGKLKGFCWAWKERVVPKKPKEPNLRVLAVTVRNLTEKDLLIESNPDIYFTEPHYNGYPAVLVRLDAIEPDELEDLLTEAWRVKAPPALRKLLAADER